MFANNLIEKLKNCVERYGNFEIKFHDLDIENVEFNKEKCLIELTNINYDDHVTKIKNDLFIDLEPEVKNELKVLLLQNIKNNILKNSKIKLLSKLKYYFLQKLIEDEVDSLLDIRD